MNQWHKVLFEAIKKSEHVVLCVPLQLNYNRNQNYAGKNSILPNRYSKGELTIYRMRKKRVRNITIAPILVNEKAKAFCNFFLMTNKK